MTKQNDIDRLFESIQSLLPVNMVTDFGLIDDEADKAAFLFEDCVEYLNSEAVAPAGKYFGLQNGRLGYFAIPPGLNREQVMSLPLQKQQARCNQCGACNIVERAKKSVLRVVTGISGRHGGTEVAEFWNRVLVENQCSKSQNQGV